MSGIKTLYLVRHAKSDWGHPNLSDFDRPLNRRGTSDAPIMGRRLKALNVKPDLILCSPACRAKETLDLLDLPAGEIRFEPSIYEAAAQNLLGLVQSLDESIRSAMLVGHNPAMSWFSEWLSGKQTGNMPTCAIATIEIHELLWSSIHEDCGLLKHVDYPKNQA